MLARNDPEFRKALVRLEKYNSRAEEILGNLPVLPSPPDGDGWEFHTLPALVGISRGIAGLLDSSHTNLLTHGVDGISSDPILLKTGLATLVVGGIFSWFYRCWEKISPSSKPKEILEKVGPEAIEEIPPVDEPALNVFNVYPGAYTEWGKQLWDSTAKKGPALQGEIIQNWEGFVHEVDPKGKILPPGLGKYLGRSQHQVYEGFSGKVVRISGDPDITGRMLFIQALLKRLEIPYLSLQDDPDSLRIAKMYGVTVQDHLPANAKTLDQIVTATPSLARSKKPKWEEVLGRVEKIYGSTAKSQLMEILDDIKLIESNEGLINEMRRRGYLVFQDEIGDLPKGWRMIDISSDGIFSKQLYYDSDQGRWFLGDW